MTRRTEWTIPVYVCARCDKGRDPLAVPSTRCRHGDDYLERIDMVVVPAVERDRYREALCNIAAQDPSRREGIYALLAASGEDQVAA